MKKLTRRLRLLPAVLIAGTALLTLKGIGIVHDASAQEQTGAKIASNATPSDGVLAAPKDFSTDDGDAAGGSEADVLSSLARRRGELDARDRDLNMRETLMQATEKRVDQKIASLKQLQATITALLGQRDAAQEKQVASLVKTYSAMKPKDAARIFNGLEEGVLIPVAQGMKSDVLAPILAAMNPDNAQKLTIKLASRLNVAVPPPPPVAAPPAVAPAPQASVTAPTPAVQASATPASAPATTPPAAPAPQAASAKHG